MGVVYITDPNTVCSPEIYCFKGHCLTTFLVLFVELGSLLGNCSRERNSFGSQVKSSPLLKDIFIFDFPDKSSVAIARPINNNITRLRMWDLKTRSTLKQDKSYRNHFSNDYLP